MSLATCTITGTLYRVTGGVYPRAQLTIQKVIKNGALVVLTSKTIRADENGVVTFTVPRSSVAYIHGNFRAGATDFKPNEGVALSIPDADTATLESLAAAAAIPVQGLTVKRDGTSLANRIGTVDFSALFTVTESPTGEANVTINADALLELLNLSPSDAGALSLLGFI